MTNSKQKGKRGEREFALLCRDMGYKDVRRGQQYSGVEGEDVIGLPGIHVEVKRAENVSLEAALSQAQRDAKGRPAIVAHRKNRGRWRITMDAEDWFTIYREYEAGLPGYIP
jgi:Holliday junction resolvase